jgi:glycosyltransferase involved in cell wall biosynthesis
MQAARAARRLQRPLVVTVKETIPEVERVHPIRRRGREASVKREVRDAAQLLIAVSEAAKQALRQEGVEAGRIAHVPPAVDCEQFRPSGREPDGIFRILFVGPALWRKGVIEAVRALRLVRDGYPARLTIVRGGADADEALSAAAKLGVLDAVTVVPQVPHDQMPALYQEADVLVAPSIPTRTWQEQDSLAVLEAMASRIPVVATAGGIRRELLGEEGYWAAAGDWIELAERLLEVAGDPKGAGRRAQALRERAVACHSVPRVAESLANCYRSVLE